MLARAHTFTIEGLHARHVTVEVDVRRGLPAFTIVGLADAAVREARERVRAAILNCGYEFPAQRITANLAPGDVPKAGAALVVSTHDPEISVRLPERWEMAGGRLLAEPVGALS